MLHYADPSSNLGWINLLLEKLLCKMSQGVIFFRHIYIYMWVYRYACMRACMRACIHTYAHAYIPTYIHTSMHACIGICMLPGCLNIDLQAYKPCKSQIQCLSLCMDSCRATPGQTSYCYNTDIASAVHLRREVFRRYWQRGC